MIYTKPINDITWDDIQEFCNQRTVEGIHLDYKGNFPRVLEKTISAMANTFGGIVLIGINEDDQNRPVLPLEGIGFRRGLEERVWNIILTNITPIVLPEVTVCLNEDETRAIIVIRINQSHQAPHAISGNEKIYLRTGNVATLERVANIDEIQWLQNRREKSVRLRKDIIENANERYKYYFATVNERSHINGQLVFSVCPMFPKDMLATPSELNFIYNDIRTESTNYVLPLPEHRTRGIIVQDGSILNEINDPYNSYHTELNSFGLLFYTETNLRSVQAPAQENRQILYVDERDILGHANLFLDSAEKYYNYLKYPGSILFNASLKNIRGIGFGQFGGNIEALNFSPDKNIFYSRIISRPPINEHKTEILYQFVQKLRWAFNLDISLEAFGQILDEIS